LVPGSISKKEVLLKKHHDRPSVKIFGKAVPLPKGQKRRRLLGCCFLVGGIFGFFPVVGYWMIPVGLLILSFDSPRIRRFRRRFDVWLMRRCALCRAWKTKAKEREMQKKASVSPPLS